MKRTLISLPLLATTLISAAGAASAQSPAPAALPTVPGTLQRATASGLPLTQAHPSIPNRPGQSPLEPYLVLWLLPASGIVVAASVIAGDRRQRASRDAAPASDGRPIVVRSGAR